MRPTCWIVLGNFVAVGALLLFGATRAAAQGGAGPADPPPEYRSGDVPITGPAVMAGQTAGIEVGQCAPDFELQPVQPYADFEKWLGSEAPTSVESGVKLSHLAGKAPILLLFGSYT